MIPYSVFLLFSGVLFTLAERFWPRRPQPVARQGFALDIVYAAFNAEVVGALVAIWLGLRPLSRNVGAKMLWAVAVYGFATLVFGLSKSFPLSLGMLALLGAADGISVFIRNTLVQLNTPDDKRGRVSSISGLAISASNELGEMQSGLAAAFLGPVGAVALGGAGAIVITAIWAVLFPELKRAKTFAPQYRQKEQVQ